MYSARRQKSRATQWFNNPTPAKKRLPASPEAVQTAARGPDAWYVPPKSYVCRGGSLAGAIPPAGKALPVAISQRPLRQGRGPKSPSPASKQLMSSARQLPNTPELGVVRLYPVPGVVVFPHTSEALHVTEPAERTLVEDALAGDRLVALLPGPPGWDPKALHWPPVPSMACLARIAAWSDSGPAAYNVLFWGIARVRIVRHVPGRSAVRQAQVELCEDCYPADDVQRAMLHQRLYRILAASMGGIGLTQASLSLMGDRVPLGVLADMVAHSLDLPPWQKDALLAECNAHRRAELLLGYVATLADAPGGLRGRVRLSGESASN